MNLFYSGIDIGSRKSHICIIDENDKRVVDEKVDYKVIPSLNCCNDKLLECDILGYPYRPV